MSAYLIQRVTNGVVCRSIPDAPIGGTPSEVSVFANDNQLSDNLALWLADEMFPKITVQADLLALREELDKDA